MKNQCPQFDKGRLLLFISLKAFEIVIEKKNMIFQVLVYMPQSLYSFEKW